MRGTHDEAPQWPDEAFKWAKKWADKKGDEHAFDSEEEIRLFNVIREEQARREPQVCGAFSPSDKSCMRTNCDGNPHEWVSAHPNHFQREEWYDPPNCDRPHMSEAAERVIRAAYKMDEQVHLDCVRHCNAASRVLGALRQLEEGE